MTRQITASIVSHGQMKLVNLLVDDLIRYAGPSLRRLVITLNVPESAPLCADHAPFEVLVLRNTGAKGFGANHNQAFLHCDTDWFAVLNPDLRLAGDPLGAILRLATDADGVLAPTVLDPDQRPADAARRVPTPLGLIRRRLGPRHPGPDHDFDWLAGMCLFINSDAFRALGGFDERYFMYCEDIDLCLRMQCAGRGVKWLENVRVIHDARRQSHRSPVYLRWHLESLARLWTSRAFWTYLARRRELRGLRQVVAG